MVDVEMLINLKYIYKAAGLPFKLTCLKRSIQKWCAFNWMFGYFRPTCPTGHKYPTRNKILKDYTDDLYTHIVERVIEFIAAHHRKCGCGQPKNQGRAEI